MLRVFSFVRWKSNTLTYPAKSVPYNLYKEVSRLEDGGVLPTNTKNAILLAVKQRPQTPEELLASLKTTRPHLQKYLSLSQLADNFQHFWNCNKKEIDADIKDESLYKHATVQQYIYQFDKLSWRGTIQYCYYRVGGIVMKGVDVKLPNDGFLYEFRNGRHYPKLRHDSKGWQLLEEDDTNQLSKIITTMRDATQCNTEPVFYYHAPRERLDVQCKDFKKNLGFSVSFEYGSPNHDFDDRWAEEE